MQYNASDAHFAKEVIGHARELGLPTNGCTISPVLEMVHQTSVLRTNGVHASVNMSGGQIMVCADERIL